MAVMMVVKKTTVLTRSGLEPRSRRKGPQPCWPSTTEAAATTVMSTPERKARMGFPVGRALSNAQIHAHTVTYTSEVASVPHTAAST